MTTPREAALEGFFRTRVRQMGGMTFKIAPTTKGLPDRLVIFPRGKVYFVELKVDGGRLSPAQMLMHHNLRQMGVQVFTLCGQGDILRWIRERVQDSDPRPGGAKRYTTPPGTCPKCGASGTMPCSTATGRDHAARVNRVLEEEMLG